MLKISLDTGLAYTKSFIVNGDLYDDILDLIDEYVQKNKKDFRTYTFHEALRHYDIDDLYNHVTPINGGEYYIDNIINIEEI